MSTRPYTDEETKAMLHAFERERDELMFLLGLKTGFRISELLSLEIKHCLEYSKVKSSINVSRSNTKGKVASRSVPINADTQAKLQSYINKLPAEQVFLFQSKRGCKLGRIQAWRIIKAAAGKLELKGNIATHSTRKSFANKVYQALDKDLAKTQRAMGHRSVNSTIQYLQVNQEEVNEAILGI